jgi:hypothetical protein
MVAYTYNPRNQEAKARVSQVPGQPQLHSQKKVKAN